MNSTYLTLEIHTRLGRASRAKLADILQDTLERFLDEAVDVHASGPIPLTGHRTSDGSTYGLYLQPAQLLTIEPTLWFEFRDGKPDLTDARCGSRIEMYGTDGNYTVTVRESVDEVRLLMKRWEG